MDGSQADNPWRPRPVAEGEWAGWGRYDTDPFENLTGPFYCRRDETGQMVCAFRAEARHMNGGGSMHGGCMATFADFAIFMIGVEDLECSGSVSSQLSTEFLGGADIGELIEARGEVTRAGASLVFVRGLAAAAGRPVFSFSSIIKKVRRRS
jgi:acyl-coenzyme A thioesterase PaaI-like protein